MAAIGAASSAPRAAKKWRSVNEESNQRKSGVWRHGISAKISKHHQHGGNKHVKNNSNSHQA